MNMKTIGVKKSPELSQELYAAMLAALAEANTLVTLVFQGDPRAIKGALSVSRAISELEKNHRVTVAKH